MRSVPSLLAICVCLCGCIDDGNRPPSVGASAHAVDAVAWTSPANVTATPGDLVKTSSAGDAWNAGAVSVEEFGTRGYMEFSSSTPTWFNVAAGLNHDDSSDNMSDIDYAIYLHDDGDVTIRENGTHRGLVARYDAGDRFRVEVEGRHVRYLQDSGSGWEEIYSSTVVPQFPLKADTSIWSHDGRIDDVSLFGTRIRIATQNTLMPAGTHSTCGENDIVVISGGWLLEMDSEITLTDFKNADEQAILDKLAEEAPGGGYQAGTYFHAFPEMAEIHQTFQGTIILDIEKPHPTWDLPCYGAINQDGIVAAYKTRIDAVDALFPNATLGLYGTLIPNSDASTDTSCSGILKDTKAPLEEAGDEGLFDNLNYVVPVLYSWVGCDKDGNPACDDDWDLLEIFTQSGIDNSSDLADDTLLVLPLLTVGVRGSASNFSQKYFLDLNLDDPFEESLGLQTDTLVDSDVGEAAFWIGNGNNYEDENIDPDGDILNVANFQNTSDPQWIIDDYMCSF